jgi:predicted TIM-barrel fold metal-dependent hydrolase
VVAKIALEEHFVTPALEGLITNPGWPPDAWRRTLDALADIDDRLSLMDRCGIDLAVLSLGSNGIQEEPDAAAAISSAVAANDALASIVASHPDRFAGFAALPLQDPAAAASELDRAVTELGMRGALVNGYTPPGEYYDDPKFWPLWERIEALGVPFYLHPRNPLPDQRRIYEGRPELLGPTWAFAVETGTHALRLIAGGVFDQFPGATVILGHLGEFLPFAIQRFEARLSRIPSVKLAKPASQYLRENFYITTSGNYHAASLQAILADLGADRVMFGADYPFEEMADGASWMDTVEISEADRTAIASENAKRLLHL